MILYKTMMVMLYLIYRGHVDCMPWKEISMNEQRRQFVALYHSGQYTKTRLCDVFGISRPTGDLWLARYDPTDPTWADDRSHVPHRVAHALSPEITAQILAVRQAHQTWGPKKIRGHLRRTCPDLACPAVSTIDRVLRTAEVVPAPTRRGQPAAWPSATLTPPTGPNTVWCADLKGWFRLGNGQRCDPLTVTDATSRFLLACDAYSQPTGADLITTYTQLFRTYGLPEVMRTDNGSPFATTAVGGLSRVSIWWLKLGIRPERIPPGQPQYNGQHERMHRTLKAEITLAADLPAQQRVFNEFRDEYNTVRPHEALGQQPPATVYVPSQRTYPDTLPEVEYPARMAPRRVRHDGYVKWQGEQIFLSEALRGELVGWDPLDERLWIVYFLQLPLAIWDTHTHRWLSRKRTRATLQHLTRET